MRTFLRTLSLFLIPFLALLVLYFVWDPFRVVYHHAPYYKDGDFIGINRGYASTMTYTEQKDLYKYDSFIFGNSRSISFRSEDWKQFLPDSSSCFHFDASGGSVLGLYEKLSYIDRCGGTIRNALFVIDNSLLDRYEMDGHLFEPAPVLKGNNFQYWMKFHMDNIKAFLTPSFFFAVVDFSLFRKMRPYMGFMVDDRPVVYKCKTNDIYNEEAEMKMSSGEYYNQDRLKVFENAQFPGEQSTYSLNDRKIALLHKIKDILNEHNTSYKIVISPLYDQVKLNKETIQVLCAIFGDNNVYDFSGPNKWNADYHNYYEAWHFRPHVARELMSLIYIE